MREICNSKTYQLSAGTNLSNRGDAEFFSHAMLRRPRADVVFDCICQAMNYQPSIRRSSKTKAVDLFEGGKQDNYNAYFFSTFGQAPRESVCACETSTDAKLSQALHLINGETIQRALRLNDGLISSLIGQHQDDTQAILSELFVRTLCRYPTAEETRMLLDEYPDAGDDKSVKEYFDGVLWALLNSSEFLFNH